MGNTPSHASTPEAAAGTGPSLSNPQNATQSLSAQPTASSSNPPPTTTNLAGSIAPTIVSSGPNFHSGLTPPLPPLSPPPPPTPPLLPHGGHLSPQNPHALSHPQAHDYSKNVVTRLILDGKLAPFYRGFEDWEEEYGEEDIARTLTEVREKDYSDGVGNSVTEAMKLERGAGGGMGSMAKKIGMHRNRQNRMEEEKDERERRERKAYIGATECPICFLNYPPNINTSRCCQQPICSECFVQIRRSEATITHLESEPACCPFCVETDFGVIYERPLPPLASLPQSALATSPETSSLGVSHTPSTGSEDTDLNVGPGMAPKTQETMRRKSVSAKSKEVVTIDEIRPDWETKLNAVKAAAARKASRRIVMRQVGDRLIPIGYTSSRAPGTADFSMSIPSSGDESGVGTPGRPRSRRQGSRRGQDLEELMIMEAMRLSLVDHEEHQRKLVETPKGATTPPAASGEHSGDSSRRPSIGMPSFSGSGTPTKSHGQSSSAASKLFSKFGNRSRSSSSASNKQGGGEQRNVSFAPIPVKNPPRSGSTLTQPSQLPTPTSPISRTPPSSLNPAMPAPVAPVMTLADSTSVSDPPPSAGLPRLSMDMAPLSPDHPPRNSMNMATQRRAPLQRAETEMSEAPSETGGRTAYAQLDSDEE